MSFKTLLVNMIVGHPNGAVLKVADELAQLLGAQTVGVTACQPTTWLISGDGYSDGTVVKMLQDEFDKEISAAEAEYRNAFSASKSMVEWRASSVLLPLTDYIVREARCADLIITSTVSAGSFDSMRHVNIGDLVMDAGRPVLVVPHAVAHTSLEQVMVAWKDTRESRRAVSDALPLLRAAKHVTVVEIATTDDMSNAQTRVADVANWLERHGIKAYPVASPAVGTDADCLDAILEKSNADLVIAGAYGHSRLREWAFGGVTESLLRTGRCALLSH